MHIHFTQWDHANSGTFLFSHCLANTHTTLQYFKSQCVACITHSSGQCLVLCTLRFLWHVFPESLQSDSALEELVQVTDVPGTSSFFGNCNWN